MRARVAARFLTTPLGLALLACGSASSSGPPCDPDNAGLELPDGFCALLVADLVVGDSVAQARHMAVADNGDIFVALNSPGGFMVLRDSDGDGRAEMQNHFAGDVTTGLALHDGYLYVAPDDRVLRYAWTPGSLSPGGEPETVVDDLLADPRRWHSAKGFAIGPDGSLYVNIGVPSNVCMEEPMGPGQTGRDPCPLLENSGGVWRFDSDRTGQTQADGERYATGLRNTFALAIHPETGALYGAQHGRDGLSMLWPDLFTSQESADKPAEEFVRIERGDDYGWPYCFYDNERGLKLLSPEYGGDGQQVGRCAGMTNPVMGFPGHWAPEAILFYRGKQFPQSYRTGAFVSFHGSWNRAPEPQGGYNVVYVPFDGNEVSGGFDRFAEGFAGDDVSPAGAVHRPTGLAEGPDGSLYVADDKGGRIYRIMYRGDG